MRNPINTDKAIRLLEVQVHLFNDFDGASTTQTLGDERQQVPSPSFYSALQQLPWLLAMSNEKENSLALIVLQRESSSGWAISLRC